MERFAYQQQKLRCSLVVGGREFTLRMRVAHYDQYERVPFHALESVSEANIYVHQTGEEFLILVSYPLWCFLLVHVHDGAFGAEGSGYDIAMRPTGDPMVVVRKLPIDMENVWGAVFDQRTLTFASTTVSFSPPYGVSVEVGTYPLTEYAKRGKQSAQTAATTFKEGDYTKYRVRASQEHFGVHFLQKCDDGAIRLAFVPSIVVQTAAGVTVHYSHTRLRAEEQSVAQSFVNFFTELGVGARDVHGQHHGIALNITPERFAVLLQEPNVVDFVDFHHCATWSASYRAAFLPNTED